MAENTPASVEAMPPVAPMEAPAIDPEDAKLEELFPDNGDGDTDVPLFPQIGQILQPKPEAPLQQTVDGEAAVELPHSPSQESPDNASRSGESGEPSAPSEEGGEAPVQRSVEEREAYDRALMALRRAKVPTDDWDADKIIEIGGPLAETQAYTDRLATELGELKKNGAVQESPEGESAGAEPPPPVRVDLSDVGQISEVLGDDAGKAVGDYVQVAVDKVMSEGRKEIEQIGEMLGQLRGIAHELTAERTRAALRERFPQAKEAESWDQIRQKATGYLQSGTYNELSLLGAYDAAFTEAARALYGNPVSPEAQARQQAVEEARDLGQVETSNRVGETISSFASVDDREEAVYTALENGNKDLAMQLNALPIK